MNPIDDQLARLFRAAAHAEPSRVVAPAYGMETRVLAAWRSRAADTGFLDLGLLVRGLLVASVIMAVSFLPALNGSSSSSTALTTTSNPFAEFLQLADSTVPADDAP
jgi:hypothetical protein